MTVKGLFSLTVHIPHSPGIPLFQRSTYAYAFYYASISVITVTMSSSFSAFFVLFSFSPFSCLPPHLLYIKHTLNYGITQNKLFVRGLHSPIKRKKVLNQLRQTGCQIAFLQETHLPDMEHDELKRSWADKVYYSSHKSGRKRGVSILVHRSVNVTATASHKDTEGRFILVNGIIDGIEISLMNVCSEWGWPGLFKKHITFSIKE